MNIDPEVDQRYNLRGHPDREPVYARFVAAGAVFRDELLSQERARLDVAYAEHPRAQLDVLLPASAPLAILIFFHGGYWRALDKSIFSIIAREFVTQGLIVVTPNYPLAPECTISAIVEHAIAASAWTSQRLNVCPIIVSGHSAGGHLAAMCATNPEIASKFAGSISISGLFDLIPLLQTNVNEQANMDEASATAMSPARQPLPTAMAPSFLLVGETETAGFLWQTERYAAWLAKRGASVNVLTVPERNHFTILEPLTMPNSVMFRGVMDFITQCLK